MKNIVITGAARSAVGAYLGSLKTVEAQDLGAAAIQAAARRSGITLEQIDQVIRAAHRATLGVYPYTSPIMT